MPGLSSHKCFSVFDKRRRRCVRPRCVGNLSSSGRGTSKLSHLQRNAGALRSAGHCLSLRFLPPPVARDHPEAVGQLPGLGHTPPRGCGLTPAGTSTPPPTPPWLRADQLWRCSCASTRPGPGQARRPCRAVALAAGPREATALWFLNAFNLSVWFVTVCRPKAALKRLPASLLKKINSTCALFAGKQAPTSRAGFASQRSWGRARW